MAHPFLLAPPFLRAQKVSPSPHPFNSLSTLSLYPHLRLPATRESATCVPYKLYSGKDLAAVAPHIEKLLTQFPKESKPFFKGLKKHERRAMLRYRNLRNGTNNLSEDADWSGWTFTEGTYTAIVSIDRQARDYYLTHLRCVQLTLDLFHER
jgi:hypothetical protein